MRISALIYFSFAASLFIPLHSVTAQGTTTIFSGSGAPEGPTSPPSAPAASFAGTQPSGSTAVTPSGSFAATLGSEGGISPSSNQTATGVGINPTLGTAITGATTTGSAATAATTGTSTVATTSTTIPTSSVTATTLATALITNNVQATAATGILGTPANGAIATQSAECVAVQDCVDNTVPDQVQACSNTQPACTSAQTGSSAFALSAGTLAQRAIVLQGCATTTFTTNAACTRCYNRAARRLRLSSDVTLFGGLIGNANALVRRQGAVNCSSLP